MAAIVSSPSPGRIHNLDAVHPGLVVQDSRGHRCPHSFREASCRAWPIAPPTGWPRTDHVAASITSIPAASRRPTSLTPGDADRLSRPSPAISGISASFAPAPDRPRRGRSRIVAAWRRWTRRPLPGGPAVRLRQSPGGTSASSLRFGQAVGGPAERRFCSAVVTRSRVTGRSFPCASWKICWATSATAAESVSVRRGGSARIRSDTLELIGETSTT